LLQIDYAEMKVMYLSEPPPFDEIIAELSELERKINRPTNG